MIQPYQSRIRVTLVYHASKLYYVHHHSFSSDAVCSFTLQQLEFECFTWPHFIFGHYHVNGQVCVKFAIVYRLFKSTHTTGSLDPLDFSGSVFTCADFQKIAQISSLCDVHYISEEITSLMRLANKSKSTAKLTVHTVGIALKS